MNITETAPQEPTYTLELTRKELMALGILSYRNETGTLANWYSDGLVGAGSHFFSQLPADMKSDIALGNTGYHSHDNKMKEY